MSRLDDLPFPVRRDMDWADRYDDDVARVLVKELVLVKNQLLTKLDLRHGTDYTVQESSVALRMQRNEKLKRYPYNVTIRAQRFQQDRFGKPIIGANGKPIPKRCDTEFDKMLNDPYFAKYYGFFWADPEPFNTVAAYKILLIPNLVYYLKKGLVEMRLVDKSKGLFLTESFYSIDLRQFNDRKTFRDGVIHRESEKTPGAELRTGFPIGF